MRSPEFKLIDYLHQICKGHVESNHENGKDKSVGFGRNK